MSYLGTPTHDQLRVFLAVVDSGSFAGAARKLARATSVVSYSIAQFEEQLGVSLFDREATRKPQLTEAGRMVLLEARTIAQSVNGLRAKVKAMHQGVEAEVSLVLDVMLPQARALDAIKAFRAAYPTVSLNLRIEALGAVTQLVVEGGATIGVSGPPDAPIDGIERVEIGSVNLIPVAAPDHPLALAGRNVPGAGREYVQVVLTDRSPRTQGQDLGVLGTHTWRVADLTSKHMLLRGGIGWGNIRGRFNGPPCPRAWARAAMGTIHCSSLEEAPVPQRIIAGNSTTTPWPRTLLRSSARLPRTSAATAPPNTTRPPRRMRRSAAA